MNSNREKIYLAALLHDIGKFYQRADTGSVAISKYLNQRNKVEGTFLPQRNGYYTHKHCLWTAQFIDDNISVFKNLLDDNTADYLTDKDNFYNLAACHHLSAEQLSDLGKIIKEADCLSSGMDRESNEAYHDDQDESSWDSFKLKRMTSLLEDISVEKPLTSNRHHLPITELNLTKEGYFSQKSFDSVPDYASLWNKFIGEFKFIQADTYKAFAETFLNLLYKYTITIPSSTINFPDVSLYDHSKTTAALAVSLYDYYQSGENNENQFLLIGGDFSGIQSYIYKIVSKYAAKNLKGRSFYLRMLSDTIVRFLLKELNLFQANVVYNSGGSFYILAPNTAEVKETLNSAIRIVEKQLFNTHKTDLFVAIDYVELSKDTLMHKTQESISDVWAELFQKRNNKKKTKFASLINNQYNLFFEPFGFGATKDRDVISGEEFLSEEKSYTKLPEFGKDNPIKEITAQQILLGRYLRDADYMVVSEDEIPYWRDLNPIEPLELGFYYYFITKSQLEQKRQELCASADRITIVSFNGKDLNCNFINDSISGINNIYGLEFYGGNNFNNSTFEDMCNTSDSDDAFSRLGVLRMDVDNLGLIFQKGIAPERATLSRLAALSRSFDYFFSGYINRIQSDLGIDRSFIVYSGGDDLFVVGDWSTMIQFAKRIRGDFRQYTCSNPAFSISGGIALITKKFPIIKGAQLSADEEDNAKKHDLLKGKNSLSFLQMPLNWDEEFPLVEALKDKIIELVDERKTLSKAFISNIINYSEQANYSGDNKITNYKIYWMLTYDISRTISRKNDRETKAFLDQCVNEICSNRKTLNGFSLNTNYHPLQLWAFACRWAELTIRTNK